MAEGVDFCLTFIRPSEKGDPRALSLENGLPPVEEGDYNCAVELYLTLLAISHLDVERRVSVATYLATHVPDTSWLLQVKGIGMKVATSNLEGFLEAIEKGISEVENESKGAGQRK